MEELKKFQGKNLNVASFILKKAFNHEEHEEHEKNQVYT
jgi:hypothetical protein